MKRESSKIAGKSIHHLLPIPAGTVKWTLWSFVPLGLPFCLSLAAAEIDETKLPAPAKAQIDFTRDIKPILETSCLRCHGPEKPKSRFRLDNRIAALKGGENGVDIVPGNSAKSRLIHYVAYLVEDMEMPPTGKGDRLNKDQIGLLRAWIDQGVAWETAPPTNELTFSISPTFGGTTVRGNEFKFREHYWQKEGFNGGAGEFELIDRLNPDTRLTVSGHALRDDYKVTLSLERNDLGFIRSGVTQFRKYFDDTGGYFPAADPSMRSAARDLHLDIGKAWIDVGLTLPHWPRMVLGYEHEYKKGEESTLTYGAFDPASKKINEGVHIIKFDLDAEVRGVTIEERFRGEFYDLQTQSTNLVAVLSRNGPPSSILTGEKLREGNRYFQGANTLRLEKKFKDWLFGSAGYLYSKLNADATFSLDTVLLFNPTSGNRQWRAPDITLEKESHVANVTALIGPFDGLTVSAGVQSEWTRQRGFGSGTLNLTDPLLVNPATFASDYDLSAVEESLAVRYTKIPFTVLFAEARLQQQSIGQSDGLSAPSDIDKSVFMQHTDFASQLSDIRVGLNTSPWRNVSFDAHYRRYENESRYHNDPLVQPTGNETAYPAFIRSRDLVTDEVQAKLVYRPNGWLKTTLGYQYLTTGYSVDTASFTQQGLNPFVPGNVTPGGNLVAGRDHSDVYSINATLRASARLSLSTTFSYQPTSAQTANNGFVAPFRGDIYSVMANGTYVLGKATDLFAAYTFSEANYGRHTLDGGLPVGIDYQQHAAQGGLVRRFGKNVSAKLQYIYYYYNEPSSGSGNRYVAHSIFGTVTLKLP